MRGGSLVLLGLAAIMAATACGGSGPRKIVLNEQVCADVGLLRLELNKTNRVILDNSRHSDLQRGMGIALEGFPMVIVGAPPPGTEIGATFTTVRLNAAPGEEAQVDVRPTFTGDYVAECRVTFEREGGGETTFSQEVRIQIVER
jgi:hypothetical protein